MTQPQSPEEMREPMRQTAATPTTDREHSPEIQRVLITGAHGMIGHALCAAARVRGMHAVPVQRPMRPESGTDIAPAAPGAILWEPAAAQPFANLEDLEGFDAVVHLAGANLSAKRWTAEYKKLIVESRTQPTGALALTLGRLRRPPKVFLTASAIGYYGSRGDEVITEASGPGTGFLSETCQAWEAATAPAEAAGIRVAHLRFGVVLTPFGGALKQMLPLFRAGLGGRLGDGQEWMSWIALEDLLHAVFHVLETDTITGPVNFVAPEPVRNIDFTHALGAALHRPAILPAPAFALRAALGEMADAALLSSCRVLPERLQQTGYQFKRSTIEQALASMLTLPGSE